MERFFVRKSSRAKKSYNRMPAHIKGKVRELEKVLENNPRPYRIYDIQKMRGMDNVYRIRFGQIRTQYFVSGKEVVIFKISYRGGAY